MKCNSGMHNKGETLSKKQTAFFVHPAINENIQGIYRGIGEGEKTIPQSKPSVLPAPFHIPRRADIVYGPVFRPCAASAPGPSVWLRQTSIREPFGTGAVT